MAETGTEPKKMEISEFGIKYYKVLGSGSRSSSKNVTTLSNNNFHTFHAPFAWPNTLPSRRNSGPGVL